MRQVDREGRSVEGVGSEPDAKVALSANKSSRLINHQIRLFLSHVHGANWLWSRESGATSRAFPVPRGSGVPHPRDFRLGRWVPPFSLPLPLGPAPYFEWRPSRQLGHPMVQMTVGGSGRVR